MSVAVLVTTHEATDRRSPWCNRPRTLHRSPAAEGPGVRGECAVTDLVDPTEMYLRTILDLEEEAIVPLRARISERLGHSGPTVSQTIARMERDGLVAVEGDRHLELTAEGPQTAAPGAR